MERNFTQNPASGVGNLTRPAWQTIVKLRTQRGWTQEKLAENSILAVRSIQNLEQGNFTRLRTISRVAEALGVPTRECIETAAPTESQICRATAIEERVAACPYRGLLAFREEDADVFFGREVFVDLLKEKLTQKNIIQVSGPSGSGKSSLIAAGLIHALKASAPWKVLYCRPGEIRSDLWRRH